jgi:hypothetical protein
LGALENTDRVYQTSVIMDGWHFIRVRDLPTQRFVVYDLLGQLSRYDVQPSTDHFSTKLVSLFRSVRFDQSGKTVTRQRVPFSELTLAYREKLWARLGQHLRIDGECTLYERHLSGNGYARLSIKGVLQSASRFVYQHVTDEQLPEHIELDHSCYNPACIRIKHLTPVDRSTNARNRRQHGFHFAGSTRSKRYG